MISVQGLMAAELCRIKCAVNAGRGRDGQQ